MNQGLGVVRGSDNQQFTALQKVCWTAHPQGAAVEHVRVDHGCTHIAVAQQLLDGSDVLPSFEEVGGKRMAEGMATGGLGHTGLTDGQFDGFLDHAGIEMVAPLGA